MRGELMELENNILADANVSENIWKGLDCI